MKDTVVARSLAFTGYGHMDSGYSAMLAVSDGSIYTALCTHNGKDAAVLVRYEPSKDVARIVADMGVVAHEDRGTSIPQGKVHTRMGQGPDGQIYFATHPTYPASGPPADAPSGYVIAYDPITCACRTVARAPDREAIITAAIDPDRMIMVALSNPSGRLLVIDLTTGSVRDLGPQTNGASPCRTIGIDADGNAWFTREPGEIVRLQPGASDVEIVGSEMPSLDFPKEAGMGVWRTVVWDDAAGLFYGIHARTSLLFSFDPRKDAARPIGPVTAEAERASPLANFASLAFARAPDGRLFYVAPRGIFDFFNSKPLRGAAHLISFDPRESRVIDHGAIADEEGRRLWGSQNAVVSNDGQMLCLLGAVEALADDTTVLATRLSIDDDGNDVKARYQLRLLNIDLSKL